MLFDRRPYYLAGLVVGLAVAALIWFGPKTTPAERVAKDVAVLAQEPWDSVRVVDLVFEGPAQHPTDVIVKGVRPNGTPVVVHFAADSPYTARSAMERLQAQDPDRLAEILMVPRSLVQPEFRSRFHRDATHAGIAYFAGTLPEAATSPAPGAPTAPGSQQSSSLPADSGAGSAAPAETAQPASNAH